MDLIDDIMAYESRELTDQECINLFSKLIKSGQCWHLQGHYGRTAQALIEAGYISKQGEVIKDV